MINDFEILMTDADEMIYAGRDLADPRERCRRLEEGGIIYFPQSPFGFAEGDRQFLLAQRQLATSYHKNIAYKPKTQRLTGIKADSITDLVRMKAIMKSYSDKVTAFTESFLSAYDGHWNLDYASFRPIEEEGRKLRLRARNDLIHVDSFPTRPVYGNRILRMFTNIHPAKVRVWRTSEPFQVLARQYIQFMWRIRDIEGLNQREPNLTAKLGRLVGLKSVGRPVYDRWMLDFHNYLKENSRFQEESRKQVWEFPPGASWMVYTDTVSHSVLSGQHALEQTFIVDHRVMVQPDVAPINVLREMYSHTHENIQTSPLS